MYRTSSLMLSGAITTHVWIKFIFMLNVFERADFGHVVHKFFFIYDGRCCTYAIVGGLEVIMCECMVCVCDFLCLLQLLY